MMTLYNLCEVYCKYHVTSVYILRSILNFINIIMTVMSPYSANEILKCFIQYIHIIYTWKLATINVQIFSWVTGEVIFAGGKTKRFKSSCQC